MEGNCICCVKCCVCIYILCVCVIRAVGQCVILVGYKILYTVFPHIFSCLLPLLSLTHSLSPYITFSLALTHYAWWRVMVNIRVWTCIGVVYTVFFLLLLYSRREFGVRYQNAVHSVECGIFGATNSVDSSSEWNTCHYICLYISRAIYYFADTWARLFDAIDSSFFSLPFFLSKLCNFCWNYIHFICSVQIEFRFHTLLYWIIHIRNKCLINSHIRHHALLPNPSVFH